MSGTLSIRPQPTSSSAIARVSKIAVAIIAVMIFSVGVLSVMALEKFKGTLKDLTESRIGVIAFDVQDNIEQGLALGINLPSLQNVQETIRRAHARDAKITAIYVIGRQGETLYRIPETAVQLNDVAVEQFRKLSEKDGLSSLRDVNSLNVVLPLQNSFSQTQGILIIQYDASSLDERYLAFRAIFLKQVIFFLIGGAAVATIAIWVLLRKYDVMDAVLAHSFASSTKAESGNDSFRQDGLADFKAKEREALSDMAAAEIVVSRK